MTSIIMDKTRGLSYNRSCSKQQVFCIFNVLHFMYIICNESLRVEVRRSTSSRLENHVGTCTDTCATASVSLNAYMYIVQRVLSLPEHGPALIDVYLTVHVPAIFGETDVTGVQKWHMRLRYKAQLASSLFAECLGRQSIWSKQIQARAAPGRWRCSRLRWLRNTLLHTWLRRASGASSGRVGHEVLPLKSTIEVN